MPIGRRPTSTTSTQVVTPTNESGEPIVLAVQGTLDPQVLADLGIAEGDPYPQGMAVAAIDAGGSLSFTPCSANTVTGKVSNFYGFLKVAVASGSTTQVITARGSTLSPFLETGITPSAGEDAYLSSVSGRVTNVAPMSSGSTVLRLGYFINETAIVFATEIRTEIE